MRQVRGYAGRAWERHVGTLERRRISARLKCLYGMTLEQVETMWEKQGGRCALCRRDLESYVVDHDHRTGKVRGLLCYGCNNGLGMLGDTIAGLEAALEYLKKAGQ